MVYECSWTASDQARADINRYYKQAYDRLAEHDPAAAANLERAQKAWISYRNAHCELATVYVGSPMAGYCPMQLNGERALQLKELAGEYDGP